MTLGSIKSKASLGSRWCAIALGFTLPISVVLDNVLLVAFIVLWLVSSDLVRKLHFMRNQPTPSMALLFAAVMLFGIFWSESPVAHLREALIDALRFIMVGLFATVFLDSSTRDRAQFAFLLSSTLILVLSFTIWSGIADAIPGLKGRPDDPVVFKNHITHNILMGIAALLFALHAMEARNPRARVLLWALAVAAMINVIFLVPGRTGQLASAAGIIYLGLARLGWRGGMIAVGGLVVVGTVVTILPASVTRDGMIRAWQEANSWNASKEHGASPAPSLRLEFYRNALEIIGEHPVIGAGSGAFRSAYEAKVRGTQMSVPPHPHNAFLHVGVELGLIGLAVLVALLVVQWRSAGTLNNFTERAAARGFLVIFIVAALVSLSFGDHTEGWFYAWASGLFFANARWPSNARA